MENAGTLLVIVVIVAMPAIIAILLTIVGSIWLRSTDLGWRLLLYSFFGSLLGAIVGCIIGYLKGYWYTISSGDSWGGIVIVLGMFLGWVIGAIVGGIVGGTVFLYRLDMRR
jgi:hypothetical protein